MGDEIDWSNPDYGDYGTDTTSYTSNTDGTITENADGTAYSSDLGSGFNTSNFFSGSDLAKLFKDSPLLQTLGAAGLGKLADKIFDVQKGPGGYKGGIPTLTASRQQYALPVVPLTDKNQARVTDEGIRNIFGQEGFGTDRMARTMYKYGISPERVANVMNRPIEQVQQQYHQALGPNQGLLGGMYGPYNEITHPARSDNTGARGMDYGYRRPGSGGVTYFSPMQYLTPAQAAAQTPATPASTGIATIPASTAPAESVAAPTEDMSYQNFARGGIANLGGYSDGGRLLRGPGDGVSDSIPATIGRKQPARLADGEFVIPARIVSELGNGSTEAGARKLYAMMDRIKKARSKAKNIAADTKSDKHLPA
jgi:hypothetical protein